MDNDNEIKDLIRRESSLFLDGSLKEIQEGKKTYDLITEFSHTKKNRSFLVPLVSLATIAIFVIAAFIVTKYIESESRKVKIDIQAFQDVNLRDLLNVAKKNADELEKAQQELKTLEEAMNNELADIEDAKQNQKDINATLKISADELLKKDLLVDKDAITKSQNVRKKYESLITQKKGQIAEIQKKIDAYDTRAMEEAKKQKAILDNQQRLFDIEKTNLTAFYEKTITTLKAANKNEVTKLEKQKTDLVTALTQKHQREITDLTAKYEKKITDLIAKYEKSIADLIAAQNLAIAQLIAKYNPTFADDRSKSLLQNVQEAKNTPIEKAVPDLLIKEGIATQADATSIPKDYSDFLYLMSKLRSVPYENSIPDTLSQTESKSAKSFLSLRNLINSSADVLKKKNDKITALENDLKNKKSQIEQFLFAFDSLVKSDRENGFIIDSRDKNDVIVYINPIYKIEDASTAWVFRQDDELIGTLIFKVSDGLISARVESLEKERTLAPFDKILINVKQEGGEQ